MNDLNSKLRQFFEEEIRNERDGGVSPSTLNSAIDSLRQAPQDVFRLTYDDAVDLLVLFRMHGGDTQLRDLLRRP